MSDLEPNQTTRRTSPTLCLAFLLYVVSMFLPAWRDNDRPIRGHEAAGWSVSLGSAAVAQLFDTSTTPTGEGVDGIVILAGFQANVGMIAGFFLSFFKGRIPRWITTLLFGVAFLMAILLAILPAPIVFSDPICEKFESGYYLWTFAFALACRASWLRLRSMIWPHQTDSA